MTLLFDDLPEMRAPRASVTEVRAPALTIRCACGSPEWVRCKPGTAPTPVEAWCAACDPLFQKGSERD